MSNFVDSIESSSTGKADLVALLVDELCISGREARDLVDAFFDVILDRLSHGESVKLAGFGNFEVQHKRERLGRNPRTGESSPISPRQVVRFSPGPKLRRRITKGELAEPASLAAVGSRPSKAGTKPLRKKRSTRSEESRQPANL